MQILKGLKDRYEAHHKVKITDEAIDAAVKLSSRYIADRYLPDKACLLYTSISPHAIPSRTSDKSPMLSLVSIMRAYLRVPSERNILSSTVGFLMSVRLYERSCSIICVAIDLRLFIADSSEMSSVTSVSYTHLDVYKRQQQKSGI